ncbi:MAG: MtrB/PioB family outer membrane beta-barrel protein [Betaproteobacteria bacterium]|nr:MtrB/PioB family outer membrane beta-barrel protein [Betaproteobacteria bacterium]
MTKTQLSILIASLFAAAPAFAQGADPFITQGQVEVGGILTDSDTRDASKFQEYQDLGNGMLSNFGIQGRNSSSWIEAYGENFGRDDLYFSVRGGMYDVFKARAYTNWMPHDFLYNGLTPFVGSGGPTLTATFPKPNPASWENVDLGYQRKDTGGYFEWQRQSPWYVRVEGNQVKTEGTKNGAASNGTSPTYGYVDLALPVQYETNNAAVEFGYAAKDMTFTANYMVSNFGNGYETVAWNNPYFGNNYDRTYLPPENSYQRLSLNGSVRALPWNSTVSARYTWDQTKSDAAVNPTVLNGAGAGGYLNVAPSTSTFNGDEVRQTFTLAWTAKPTAAVDTKVYYNWQEMQNDSTDVVFCASGAASCGGTFENELWDYKKQNFGAEAHWKVNRGNRIGGGWDWLNIEQNRFDFDESTSNLFWFEWKNTSFDTLSARVKYSYLDRSSNFLLGNAGPTANDVAYLFRYVKAFDLADLKQNRVKLTLDWAPSDALGVTAEYIYKDNDYSDTQIGRTSDTRNEIFANLTYGSASSWRVSLFGDYENVKYESFHRYVGASPVCTTATGPNCYSIDAAPTSSSYNWNANVKNDNWILGVGADAPVGDRWLLTGSLLYEQTDGSADMSAQNNYGNPLPLPNYPNIKTTSLNLKAAYKVNRNWTVTGGYAYQKYDYDDIQYNGYTSTVPFNATTSTTTSYLNGWNAFQTYNANIFYLTARFAWDAALPPPPALKVAEAPRATAPVTAPPPPPAPKPATPAPAPVPAPQVQKITLDSKVLFDFDQAVLKPEGKAAIDSQVVGKLAQVQKLEVVLVTGHTDRLGSDAYNQKLSVKRADAVRDYLVGKGVDKAKIETLGLGEKQPVVQCEQKNRKELIACLAPNRRVEVQVKGEATRR